MPNTHEPLSDTRLAVNQSVHECMLSGDWKNYSGPCLVELSRWFQSELSTQHVRFCSSGTLGIEIALRALHLRPDDEVILCSYDYPGNFRSVELVGAKPVLCRPSHGTALSNRSRRWTLDVADMELCAAPTTKAIIVSHLHGEVASMPQIMDWARERKLAVIEDACQAHGGSIGGKKLGAWGDIGVFSFGGSKLVSAGRGGAIVTNSDLLAQRMTHFCERGNDAFALAEIQAAIALPQCLHLARDHERRSEQAQILAAELRSLEWLEPVSIAPNTDPAFYKFGLCIAPNHSHQFDREDVLRQLQSRGVLAGEGFRSFAKRSPKRFRTPFQLAATEDLAATTIVIHHDHLMHPTTGNSSVAQVIDAFRSIQPTTPSQRT